MSDAQKPSKQQEPQAHELSVLREVAQALNASVDLPSLLNTALEKVAALLELDTGWVLLFDEKTGTAYTAASQNLPGGLEDNPERMTGGCYCLDLFKSDALTDAANVGVVKCSRLRQVQLADEDTAGLQYHASIPLKVTGSDKEGGDSEMKLKRLGMLNVASSEWREITETELDILRTIGGLLGVAIERAHLHSRRLEAAQTEERLRMAREIHDTIAQDFSAIALQLDTAEVLVEANPSDENITQSIREARRLANKGLRDARRSVHNLRAAPLEGRTLPEAIEALAGEVGSVEERTVSLDTSSLFGSLPPAIEVGLYRIAQEAVQNAKQHAGAKRIDVKLERSDDSIRLIVEDDGEGFEVDAVASDARESGRFGLVGMRERARLLGGALYIESEPGIGTRVCAEAPINQDV